MASASRKSRDTTESTLRAIFEGFAKITDQEFEQANEDEELSTTMGRATLIIQQTPALQTKENIAAFFSMIETSPSTQVKISALEGTQRLTGKSEDLNNEIKSHLLNLQKTEKDNKAVLIAINSALEDLGNPHIDALIALGKKLPLKRATFG